LSNGGNYFNRVTEITMICPTVELTKKARKIIGERKEDIEVFTSSPEVDAIEDALRIARNLVKRGTKIILSRKGTAVAIKESKLDVSVVVINNLLSDYIDSLQVAKEYNGPIAFFTYDEITEDVKTACYMLGIEAKYYIFKSDEDAKENVLQAIKNGVVLGIGGSMTQKYADLYGLKQLSYKYS